MSSLYVVAVVVEADFGARLDEIAGRMPVWIADTPLSRAAADKHWAAHREQTHLKGVTTFEVDASSEECDGAGQVVFRVEIEQLNTTDNCELFQGCE
jgi:hypothetical protein